jgi:hypothetical protein
LVAHHSETYSVSRICKCRWCVTKNTSRQLKWNFNF